MQVKVNGIPVFRGQSRQTRAYWMIQRSWQPGDTVSCEMEMEPERVYAHPMVRADAGCVALRRGPIIYTFEGRGQREDLQTLRISRGRAKIEALSYQADLLEGYRGAARDGLPEESGGLIRRFMQKMRHRKRW